MNPYRHRKKRIEKYGFIFDNADELKRYELLMLRYRAGEITEPEVHPAFDIVINGQKIGTYKADFRYALIEDDLTDSDSGRRCLGATTIEDCKPGYNKKKKSTRKGVVVREWKERAPFLTEGYRFKKRVVEAACNIVITEIWK